MTRNFANWPPHCVVGTAGQQKPASTLLETRVTVRNKPGLPEIENAQQILLEKQALDCFTNVNLKALLERLGADRYIVYGVVTEICVKYAALGLLENRPPRRTGDRCCQGTGSRPNAAEFLAAFTRRQGGVLTTVSQV